MLGTIIIRKISPCYSIFQREGMVGIVIRESYRYQLRVRWLEAYQITDNIMLSDLIDNKDGTFTYKYDLNIGV